MSDEETCKECGHHWGDHYANDGCYGGWEYGSDGIATTEGCHCLLTHSRLSFARPQQSNHGWWADREQRPDDDPPDEIVCDGRDCGGRPHS